MTAREVARKMVTVDRANGSAGYGRWRLSIARRALHPQAGPWLQIWHGSRAHADDARKFRRAIQEGICDALALGVMPTLILGSKASSPATRRMRPLMSLPRRVRIGPKHVVPDRTLYSQALQ